MYYLPDAFSQLVHHADEAMMQRLSRNTKVSLESLHETVELILATYDSTVPTVQIVSLQGSEVFSFLEAESDDHRFAFICVAKRIVCSNDETLLQNAHAYYHTMQEVFAEMADGC